MLGDCFCNKLSLARFTGQPQDSRKGRTYMRKRFKAVTQRGKGYKGEMNGGWIGEGFL